MTKAASKNKRGKNADSGSVSVKNSNGRLQLVFRHPETHKQIYNVRHTAINAALKAGVAVADVAYFVGNSPETIMKHYISRTDSAQLHEI